MNVTNPEKLGAEIRERTEGFKDQETVKSNIAKEYTKGAIIDLGGDLIRIESYDEKTGKMRGEKITSNKTIEELSRPAGKIDEANLDGQKEFIETNLLQLVGDLKEPSMENLPKVVPENELEQKIGELLKRTEEDFKELEQTLQKAGNNKEFLNEHKADWQKDEFTEYTRRAAEEYDTTKRLLDAKEKELNILKSFVADKKIEVKNFAA